MLSTPNNTLSRIDNVLSKAYNVLLKLNNIVVETQQHCCRQLANNVVELLLSCC